MAWYRCGGGGLPAGLQSDMDTVLNKKFSTSTTYPPTDWPDTVNLMGPLPEKTASSASVCSFSDGADDVPMKSVIAHIAPTLTGVNAVNMVRCGKNLIKPDKYQTAGNNLALGQNDGTSFGTFLKAGTYTISYTTTGETCYIYRREENDGSNTNMGKKLSTNFTLGSDGNFRFWLYGDGAVSANISSVQIEVGSTATAYEPYVAPTTYTANLGKTVYGGQADIVSGQGIDENGDDFTFDGQEIPSLLGVNNLWHDAGETECTYRADISLALQALGGGGRGLMMMRPTEPEETEETEETEGLENELNR